MNIMEDAINQMAMDGSTWRPRFKPRRWPRYQPKWVRHEKWHRWPTYADTAHYA